MVVPDELLPRKTFEVVWKLTVQVVRDLLTDGNVTHSTVKW